MKVLDSGVRMQVFEEHQEAETLQCNWLYCHRSCLSTCAPVSQPAPNPVPQQHSPQVLGLVLCGCCSITADFASLWPSHCKLSSRVG